jgi:hypothetical protein
LLPLQINRGNFTLTPSGKAISRHSKEALTKPALYQGTTSVVPQSLQNQLGL